MSEKKTEVLPARVSKDLLAKIEQAARREGRSRSSVVERALAKVFSGRPAKPSG